MIKNYFLIAIRTLKRNLGYSFINITGLAIGIACSLFILLWVNDELSFNKFHKNYNSLYKVHLNSEFSDGIRTQIQVPHPLKDAILNKSNKVKHAVISNQGEGNMLAFNTTRINKVGLCVGEDFLKMFSFPLINGNLDKALSDPYSIVLTETTANALFGKTDPINKTIKIDNDLDVKVTAIIKDVPDQSSLTFDYLLPYSYYQLTQAWTQNAKDNWLRNSLVIYVELQPDASIEEVNSNIANLVNDNNPEVKTTQVFLHPMKQWRLYSEFKNGKVSGGNIEYVRMFTIIAIFVLVIACINFMNLATARSESRAREVGVRKSVGSRRKDLIFQFLGESIIITFISFVLGLILVETLLPFYNTLVHKHLTIDYSNLSLWLSAIGLIILVGTIAGSYPAFYLSGFQPVKVLKGKISVGKNAVTPRKILVTFQFAVSIFLIVGTTVLYLQINYVKNRSIGYDKENLMLIWTNSEIENNFQTIREELMRTGVVKSACKSNSPITRIFASNTVEWPGKQSAEPIAFTTIATEYDYAETMNIKMLEGRDFSRDFPSDSAAIIINKSALNVMGLKNPIGEHLKMWDQEWTIIGVMEDVIMGAPDQPIAPLAMIFSPGWSSTMSVRLEKTTDLNASIAKVEDVFKKLSPSYPLWYRFADEEFNKKFASINLISRLAFLFALLAIIITCLGLFGLAAFSAAQRSKEISIRKVMGATLSNLVFMISSDFSKLVLFAFLIAAPLSWFALSDFLERYPYRTSIPVWAIPCAGLVALVLAVLIVGIQALRAAVANPATTLRNE